ncbi:Ribosomal protein L34e superfamily protein [Striga hermonthica]|uniref:Ribosomal protein L34e superfamily protein n=1 Tax=Striga hermonthica TaxID=68872 RepID=A0A9N7RG35_STRHE|nr:Ribosomal protein L34e superfamily protein [Striga hermonthica]
MVFLHGPIPADRQLSMAKSVNSPDPSPKSKQINQLHKNRRISSPDCDQSPYAIIDVIILIAVISASCFLFYPYAMILARKCLEIGGEVVEVVIEEITRAPMVFACLGLSIFFASMALVVIAVYTDSRCGKPGCRGLRKAPEFDIQLETEENSKRSLEKNGFLKGLHEVHHKELEAELKKMAPPNGKAILVFRARCGCSVGWMEVSGPRKNRKVKK